MTARNNKININLPYNDVTESYKHILPKIARLRNISVNSIQIIEHSCGEDTIFSNGEWIGYVDAVLFAETELIAEYDEHQRTESLQDFVYKMMSEL